MSLREPGSPISAILPNYNHARYLPEAVWGLARQVPAPLEIIVIDDASTDDSPVVLAALAAEIPNLRVLREDVNRGTISALNRGLAEAQCPYVYFGAADDVVWSRPFNSTQRRRSQPASASLPTSLARCGDLDRQCVPRTAKGSFRRAKC
jgi:glycosyltransferase involved in cell wall biosynthesis